MLRLFPLFFSGNEETLTLENQISRSEEEGRHSFESVSDSVRNEEAIWLGKEE